MSTFNWRIPWSTAMELGMEAVAIIEAGHYQAPSGRTIDVAGLFESAKAGTESYPPELLDEVQLLLGGWLAVAQSSSQYCARSRFTRQASDFIVGDCPHQAPGWLGLRVSP